MTGLFAGLNYPVNCQVFPHELFLDELRMCILGWMVPRHHKQPALVVVRELPHHGSGPNIRVEQLIKLFFAVVAEPS